MSASSSTRPLVIAAFLGTQALGDFVMCLLTASSFVRAFPGSKLIAIYRNDRPYKDMIAKMSPFVTTAMSLPANPDSVIPLDWFDGDSNAAGRPFDKAWRDKGFHNPDIFLTPSMLVISRCLVPPPKFCIPPKMEEILSSSLRLRGVDGDRWFVCLHMREHKYRYRKFVDGLQRSVKALSYLPMIENIINKQGGQVVRLGDPSMEPLPEMEGLIDLSRDENSFPEQAFALSRARCFIGTDTGMTQLAAALKTPTATTNARAVGVWNDGDVALFKRAILPEGETIDHRDYLEVNNIGMPPEITIESRIIDNPPGELIKVSEHMLDITSDCLGWRKEAVDPPCPAPASPRNGGLTLPAQWRCISEFAQLTYWEVDGKR